MPNAYLLIMTDELDHDHDFETDEGGELETHEREGLEDEVEYVGKSIDRLKERVDEMGRSFRRRIFILPALVFGVLLPLFVLWMNKMTDDMVRETEAVSQKFIADVEKSELEWREGVDRQNIEFEAEMEAINRKFEEDMSKMFGEFQRDTQQQMDELNQGVEDLNRGIGGMESRFERSLEDMERGVWEHFREEVKKLAEERPDLGIDLEELDIPEQIPPEGEIN